MLRGRLCRDEHAHVAICDCGVPIILARIAEGDEETVALNADETVTFEVASFDRDGVLMHVGHRRHACLGDAIEEALAEDEVLAAEAAAREVWR